MEVRRISGEKVRGLYNQLDDMWGADSWHDHTRKRLALHLKKCRHLAKAANVVLHLGSAGESYGLQGNWTFHIDLAEKRLRETAGAVIGDIHSLPIQPHAVNFCTCVGSVLNYCDAVVVLGQISKILKPGAHFVLEFETSDSWEYAGKAAYRQSAALSETFYGGDPNCRLWLYSLSYIKALLQANDLAIKKIDRSHVLSSLVYRWTQNDVRAARYGRVDHIAGKLPILSRGAANIILLCQKTT
jgi:SAM-dependent methyltransferase